MPPSLPVPGTMGRQPGCGQRRGRVEKACSGLVVKVGDRYQQPREDGRASHGMLLPGDGTSAAGGPARAGSR